ncbi:hypothetical protein TNCV_1470351 [Trichonephila clavipes]|nr:hypothetical protein TNCV_1470351 [Trichonephila clavipes]
MRVALLPEKEDSAPLSFCSRVFILERVMGPLYDSLGGISSVSICSAGSWYGFIRSTWTTSLSFLFVKQDQNLVLRKSRLINGVAPDTVRNTFLRVFGETDFSHWSINPYEISGSVRYHLVFGIVTSTIFVLSSQRCTRASCRDSSALAAILVMLLSSKSLGQNGSIVSSVVSASRP